MLSHISIVHVPFIYERFKCTLYVRKRLMGETELFENILIKCCSFIWNKRLAPSWQQKTHHYDDDILIRITILFIHMRSYN